MKKLNAFTALLLALLMIVMQPMAAMATEVGNYKEYQGFVSEALEAASNTSANSGDAQPSDTESVIYGHRATVALSAGAAELPSNGLLTIEAEEAGQWQVYAPSMGIWVGFYGEQSTSLNVTYAKIANLLDGNTALVRSVVNGEPKGEMRITVTAPAEVISAVAEKASTPVLSSKSVGNGIALAAEIPATYTVVINYVFADGNPAASPYTANVAAGSDLNVTVNSPVVLGYAPDRASVAINQTNIQGNITETVTYQPAEVKFVVLHYQQNLTDDNYTLVEREEKTGYTEAEVGPNLAIDPDVISDYKGFYSLLYDTTTKIAADGSTVVEIYYDRYYYLMNFELDGGYGVEPIYARYGAAIDTQNIGTPTKPGYTFSGWQLNGKLASVPTTMPAENRTYTAIWGLDGMAKVTVVFWGENANDTGDSYHHSGTVFAAPNEPFTFSDTIQFTICGQEAHTHDGTCKVVQDCTKSEHTHGGGCCNIQENDHNHTSSCYDGVGSRESLADMYGAPSDAREGQVYTYYSISLIYINGDWYRYNGDVESGEIAPRNSSCPSHTHGDGKCSCNQEEHTHDDGCATYSCGMTSHLHKADCYQYGAGMDTNLWTLVESETVTVAADGTSIVNVFYDRKPFTIHFRRQYSNNDDYGTIEDKWGANIGDRWIEKSNTANSTNWSEDYYASSPWTGYLDIMPEKDMIFYAAGNGSNDADYYLQDLDGNYGEPTFTISGKGGGVTKEDFFTMEGFTYDHGTSGYGTSMPEPGSYSGFNGAEFYYTRNSYQLEFMSSGTKLEDHTATVKYEAPLAQYNFEPPYPSNLEPNAYAFEGWYTDQYFTYDMKWDVRTMPASDMILYAHWVSVTHKVNFYQTEDALAAGTKYYEEQLVKHGQKIAAVADPDRGEYTFIGWFYMEDGVEKAFDPDNMPVNKDLDLYGKWSSNTLMEYTIKYAVENSDGTLTYIADEETGSGLAGSTKTFEAKAGAELYEDYRSGYFPVTNSHSMAFNIDGGNEFTFFYVQKTEVSYTVRYLEEGTNAVLHEEKTVETVDAIVTETFVPVTGYMPDAYQKRLVLSATDEENVITFWYVEDDTHAPLHIVHYTQNIAGEEYTIYQESTDINALIGREYSEDPLTIPGFAYKLEKSTPSGTMTAAGLELTLYYDRIEYPYEFRFLEQGTDTVLADSVTGTERYQAQVTQNAKPITGYTLVSRSPQVIQIAIEDPADVAVHNVRIFYYQENEVTIEYKVVGPDGTIDTAGVVGRATPASETIKVRTDVAGGSTAAPASAAYKFAGWYTDEACTTPVDAAWVTNDTHLTPAKTGNVVDGEAQAYEAATYYAKFENALGDLVIRKTGMNQNTIAGDNESAIFTVEGDGKKWTVAVLCDNAGNGSATLKGLSVGEYTVTELTDWTWRYNGAASATVTVVGGGSVEATFANSFGKSKWLGGDNYKVNEFGANN